MSKKRRHTSASDDNRATASRRYSLHSTATATATGLDVGYASSRASVRRAKSAQSRSPPPRIFIKPKLETVNDECGQRTSVATARPTQHGYNTRAAASALARPAPRRSSSLHYSTSSTNAPPSRLPRSSTLLRPVNTKLISGPDANLNRQDTIGNNSSVAIRKAMRAPSPESKENRPSAQLSTSHERSVKQRYTPFIRKQSPLVPKERRTSQQSPSKVFLLPKDEGRPKHYKSTLSRHSSESAAVIRPKRKTSLVRRKTSHTVYPSLPSIVMEHSPPQFDVGLQTNQLSLEEKTIRTPDEALAAYASTPNASAVKPSPRPFLLPRKPGTMPSSSSIHSLVSLPTQVLKHTPVTSASGSPCISKARIKTIWTMMDEIRLVKSGGLLTDQHALVPSSQARVIPLFQRFRHEADTNASPQGVALGRTPVRSASTPYHLLASAARRSSAIPPNALPRLPSLSRALANALVEQEEDEEDNFIGIEDQQRKDSNKEDKQKSNNWGFMDVKRLQRRSTVSNPVVSTEGYKVYLKGRSTKPSLLSRAQTLAKLKFSGSRKVVGRGDPKWN
ncbi:uncharacterized protein FOMMEDRAFT_152232 [Fomitiporia mediterranea MF3/22]|uniref:uncharacterized protein n=1 Tax=Fomitiporia mediterranea (strain MF3/22) TaxID=694068 RepID=UPI000440735B|nr:uncharacterized protein FOMMEDRAFT_152232 [Fomitiporia mediterranea MF3/22]EJD06903.1 hypothetical protein FOMMEDRAFT_152232 [Fomitiporia mediterranea MF3/22]